MTATKTWTAITRTENVPLREGRAVKVGDVEIAIFNINGRFLTIENACPHKGGPLCDGIVSGTTVVCPLHGQRFDLETGMPVLASQPGCVATFPTRVEGDVIFVDLDHGIKVADIVE
ncbi:MAG: nitrite reductase small subunit NirD [Acidobacteriota bacterium]